MSAADHSEFSPGWPMRDRAIETALHSAYESGDWGRYHGDCSTRLTSALRDLFGVPHAYLCCSGTFAVELALRAFQLPQRSEIILCGYDFSGNFRAIEAAGHVPLLLDCGPDSWTYALDDLAAIEASPAKAIIVSHLHGELAPMQQLLELAAQKNWLVVEDACQAHGASIDNRRVGSMGHVGVLSFGGSKLLTAGRGGAILTHDEHFIQRAVRHCEQGNHAYPLSELQAAVLVPQCEALMRLHELRAERAERLRNVIAAWPSGPIEFRSPAMREHASAAYYKFGLRISRAGSSLAEAEALRDRAIARVYAAGIALDTGFRSFAQRSEKRCRKLDSLARSARAAAETAVLHHPILIAEESLFTRFLDRWDAIGRAIIAEETT